MVTLCEERTEALTKEKEEMTNEEKTKCTSELFRPRKDVAKATDKVWKNDLGSILQPNRSKWLFLKSCLYFLKKKNTDHLHNCTFPCWHSRQPCAYLRIDLRTI